jgi:hypothetical protein
MTVPCCLVDDPCPDHGESSFAGTVRRRPSRRGNRVGVPSWVRGESHVPEEEVQAG